ncbi:ABC transporter substrate-binding protein [Shimia sp.]|uniref:ABC transporter substrate-binding protein n=1 Tax=Shimia sp. TaxID=1954381 RepID=UPI00329939A3
MSRVAAYALAILATLSFWSPISAQSDPVKVGCLYPLTGPGGLYGRDSAVAIKLAQNHLNSLQPAEFPQIEVIIEDTRSKSLRSVQIARNFIEVENVDFLCGVVSSNIARAVSNLAAEYETFFIGTDHASPTLVTEALHPYYFRVSNGTRLSMLAGAQFIKENYGQSPNPIKIAFIGPDYEYGYQAWHDLKGFLDAHGVAANIQGEYWPKLFETDYTPYIQQLLKDELDILVSGHWGLDLVTFVKQAKQLGLFEHTQFINFDAGGNYEILAELGNDMPLGLVLSARHHVNWPPTRQNKAFVDRFYEEAGRYPSYAAQGAYAGILAIAEAVRQTGGLDDKEKLRLAFENLSLSLPEDPEDFRSHMDPKSHQMLQVQAIGRTVFDNRFPPATVQLGEWSVYYPPAEWPQLPD